MRGILSEKLKGLVVAVQALSLQYYELNILDVGAYVQGKTEVFACQRTLHPSPFWAGSIVWATIEP
jgi:hypothetical protein